MTKEALKMALEALELSHPRFGIGTAIHIKAVAVIKEALAQPDDLDVWKVRALQAEAVIEKFMAQPEQEPVAYIRVSKTGHVMACAKTGDFYSLPHKTLLYTAPPQRKPLSDEEIERIYDRYGGNMTNCARAIERAHGIKGKA